MNSFKILRVGFAACTVLLAVVPAAAQQPVPYSYLWDGGSGAANNFWDLGANWNVGASMQANNAVPYAYFHEMGLIGSAAFPGPFTVNVRTAQDTFGTSPSSPVANRRQAGGVTVDLGSTLNIQSTGILKVVVTNGLVADSDPLMAATGTEIGLPVPGTGNAVVNGGGAITIQSGGRLEAEDNVNINNGTLTVLPGGTVTAQNVNSGATGAIVLSGNATLNSTGSTTLNGRTTITGPGVVFNSGEVVMNDGTVFNPVITGASHTIMNVNGPVTMNGTLRPQFQGVTPNLGDTWVIWDSTLTGGSFDVSDDSLTDVPTGHRYTVATTTAGSVHGARGLLTVENFLTAEVNRANGQVTLRNTAATGGVTIDGYQITSAAGVLNPNKFTSSLTDDGFDGGEWIESNLSAGTIGELNAGLNDSSLIATSSMNLLGDFYDPIPTLQQFGDPVPEDLVFTYRRSDGRFVIGPVDYINEGVTNTLVLQVDPVDGKARIINDSAFDGVRFDSYSISSPSGSLQTTWNSLDKQNVGGADTWLEAAPIANLLTELNVLPRSDPQSSVEVDAGETAAVMTGLFNVAGTRDLTFQFRAASPSGAPIGDYNNNGAVDAADYTTWRDLLGQSVTLPNEDPTMTPGSVTQDDYLVWTTNFGNTGGGELGAFEVFTGVVRYASFSAGSSALTASSVPEPSCCVLAVTILCGLFGTGRRGRSEVW